APARTHRPAAAMSSHPAPRAPAKWTPPWTPVGESVTPIRIAAVDFAQAAGATRRSRDAVALATSEAAANAIIHAFGGAAAPGDVTISISLLADGRLRVVVSDDGAGMSRRDDSPGLGLGLPLIGHLTDSVDIASTRGEGTRVTMDFRLDTV